MNLWRGINKILRTRQIEPSTCNFSPPVPIKHVSQEDCCCPEEGTDIKSRIVCEVREWRVRARRRQDNRTTGQQDNGTTGAMYANDSAMYASNRNHDEGNEVDGDKQQVFINHQAGNDD